MTTKAIKKQPTKPSNDDLLDSFAANWRARAYADSTLKEYLRYLRLFATSIDRNLLDVDRKDLESFVTGVLDRLTPASAAYAARSVKAFYKWLHDDEGVSDNPGARIHIPTVPVPATKIADPAEVKLILATCREGRLFKSFIDRRDGTLIHVIRSTGMRIGEAAAIEIRHIDLAAGTVLIPHSKSRKPRTVGLDPKALDSLRWYMREIDVTDRGCLWRTSTGHPLTKDGVKQAFLRRARKAGLKVTPHQLRRGFAAEWCRRGGTQAGLQTMAGWNSPAMVARYIAAQAGELALEEQRRLFAS